MMWLAPLHCPTSLDPTRRACPSPYPQECPTGRHHTRPRRTSQVHALSLRHTQETRPGPTPRDKTGHDVTRQAMTGRDSTRRKRHHIVTDPHRTRLHKTAHVCHGTAPAGNQTRPHRTRLPTTALAGDFTRLHDAGHYETGPAGYTTMRHQPRLDSTSRRRGLLRRPLPFGARARRLRQETPLDPARQHSTQPNVTRRIRRTAGQPSTIHDPTRPAGDATGLDRAALGATALAGDRTGQDFTELDTARLNTT